MIEIIDSTIVLIICLRPGALYNIKSWQLGSAIFVLNKNNAPVNTILPLWTVYDQYNWNWNWFVFLRYPGSDGIDFVDGKEDRKDLNA